MSELVQQAKRLADLAEKMLREAERLHRDVRSLGNRIVKLPTDDTPGPDAYVPVTARAPKSFVTMFDVLNEARLRFEGAERDIGTIKAALDAISNDAWLRDDLKQWIISHPPKRGE